VLLNLPILRGIVIEYNNIEFGIKKGSILTIFGDINYDLKSHEITLFKPLYYMIDKFSLIK